MKLIIDENMPPGWIAFFVAARIEAYEWESLGLPNAPDSEIIEYAAREDYVILTRDLDFGTHLAKTQAMKPSVIQVRTDDTAPESIGQQVLEAIQQNVAALNAGALITVEAWSRPRTKINFLPIPWRRPPSSSFHISA